MNDKKLNLIKSGMKLFAAKGYHQTSIQAIATDAGISKGGFYLYFQSKEDFIATAVQYFYKEISDRIALVKQENFPPKQSLAKQITVVTKYIYRYKYFIIMYLRENISIVENTDKLIHQMKTQNFHWLKDNIEAIYGEKINAYSVDAVVQLEGLMHGYFQWIVVNHVQINIEKVGSYLVRRLDDIVQGMTRQNEEALITEESLPDFFETMIPQPSLQRQLAVIISTMHEKVDVINDQDGKTEHLNEVLDELFKAVNKQEPQHIMIQGLLAHLTSIPMLYEDCTEIAKLLNLKLLD